MVNASVQKQFEESVASSEHQALVEALVKYLEENGWKVYAAAGLEDYESPTPVADYIPDVKAMRPDKSLYAYGEAETCESLNSEHTENQIEEFSSQLKKGKTDVLRPCFVIVPKSCFRDLKSLIRSKFSDRQNITPLFLG